MLIGALLDAGLPLEPLRSAFSELPLPEHHLSVDRVVKAGLPATQFRVHVLSDGTHHHHGLPDRAGKKATEAFEVLSRATSLTKRARSRIESILTVLLRMDAEVRGLEGMEALRYDDVHFTDTLIDVFGVCWGLEYFDVEEVYCSPLPAGRSEVRTAHGIVSVPSDLTLAILSASGAPTTDQAGQLTATGAAILTTLAHFAHPWLEATRRGFGAGEANTPWPNVVGLEIGSGHA
jgi:pyridinium-3,5-bisthiocarboxylic acid mononucleotide nickel chelatase